MTGRECAIVEAYTGYCMCAGEHRGEVYKYVSEILGESVWTHEFATRADEIRAKARPDFERLCKEAIWDE